MKHLRFEHRTAVIQGVACFWPNAQEAQQLYFALAGDAVSLCHPVSVRLQLVWPGV